MLGAGFVTKPTLDILSQSGITVTVGMWPGGMDVTGARRWVANLHKPAGRSSLPRPSRLASRTPFPSLWM